LVALGVMKDPFIAVGVLKDPFLALGAVKDPFIAVGVVRPGEYVGALIYLRWACSGAAHRRTRATRRTRHHLWHNRNRGSHK
jgi:hypothetical protein